jgi:uncharacterized protein (TIGR01244 family)
MSEVRQLDEKWLVAGQISPDDLVTLRRHGVTVIVNNRPDGEEPGQPGSAEMAAAAEAAGLHYRHIPIARGIGPAEVEEMKQALVEAGEGKLLAFCRSGMRSTLAWAVAMRELGVPRDKLLQKAEAAGFSLAPVDHLL